MNKFFALLLTITLLLSSVFCSQTNAQEVFSLAWSEYPSWSVFGVAAMTKVNGEFLIEQEEGKLGTIEKKWGVDLVFKELDYDSCLVLYGSGKCDAVCITNMDTLKPSLTVRSVAIMPTSTSYGADADIVTNNIKTVQDLKGKKTFGLDRSVSEYCWARNIQLAGEKEKGFKFVNMDPAAAATAMQQSQKEQESIIVWNPFVLETLNKRKDVHVLFDSTSIPGEIVDMVVMSQKSLERKDGDKAALAILDTYYTISKRLADKNLQDDTLVALGEKFSHLNAESMKTVVRQTRFYSTPEQGISLFTNKGVVFPWKKEVKETSDLFTNNGFNPESKEVTDKLFKDVMPLVIDFCVNREMTPKKPVIVYGTKEEVKEQADLRFDPTFMKKIQKMQKPELK